MCEVYPLDQSPIPLFFWTLHDEVPVLTGKGLVFCNLEHKIWTNWFYPVEYPFAEVAENV